MALAETSPPAAATVRRNQLLNSIADGDRERLRHDLRLVDLEARSPIYAANAPIRQVYFPIDCVISIVSSSRPDDDDSDPGDRTSDRAGVGAVELNTTGMEGVVGLPAFLGAVSSPHEAFCQVPGQALRLDVGALDPTFGHGGAPHQLMLRYTQAVMVFLGQNVACNQLHSTRQRCARWLAQTQDRVGRDTFFLKQEFLAQMLGVRRGAVSASAGVLQRDGLITYSRGQLTVLDHDGLRYAACRCYQLIRREFETLQGLDGRAGSPT